MLANIGTTPTIGSQNDPHHSWSNSNLNILFRNQFLIANLTIIRGVMGRQTITEPSRNMLVANDITAWAKVPNLVQSIWFHWFRFCQILRLLIWFNRDFNEESSIKKKKKKKEREYLAHHNRGHKFILIYSIAKFCPSRDYFFLSFKLMRCCSFSHYLTYKKCTVKYTFYRHHYSDVET